MLGTGLPLLALILTQACLAPASVAQSLDPNIDYEALEAAVLAETNRLRLDPQAYADRLVESKAYYRGNLYRVPGQIPIRTREGVVAVDEAIVYLNRQEALGELSRSIGMDQAAADQAADQAQTGKIGHIGSDNSTPSQRLNRYGAWKTMAAENISYGAATGAEVVRQLIIDDGFQTRGHRIMLLNPVFEKTGVACGPHPRYRVMCVMTYAGDYEEAETQ
ncbi:MAG: CAP domain-containing protein [Prochlorotrichaceae cyanobacterium]